MKTSLWLALFACSIIGLAPTRGQEAKQEKIILVEVPSVPDTNPSPDLAAVSKSIIERTNAFRKEEKLPPVTSEEKIAKAAQAFADYMATNDRYGHSADDRKPADRAKSSGYDYCIVLENIAYAFNSKGFTKDELAEEFTTGWKKSPGHRRNMLDGDVTHTGVAVARSTKTGYYYAVQMFGRPKSAAMEFKVENRAGTTIEYSLGETKYSLQPRYARTHTTCRPPEVTFHWAADPAKTETVKPAAGAKLVVSQSQAEWKVEKK